MLRSVKDINDAVNAGRTHSQRFIKSAGGGADLVWHDWSFASGQPAYDARIGNAGAMKPMIAAGNDAIYFPPASGMDRRILDIEVGVVPGGTTQLNVEFHLYDIVGVYPLIDGDNTDPQPLDNTLPLPRYADGKGIFPVLVNHVAPSVAPANVLVQYTNADGVDHSATWHAPVYGVNRVCYTTSTGAGPGPIYCAISGGDLGVKSINELQFVTAPGGLWAIYMCKPLGTFASRNLAGSQSAVIAYKSFLTENALKLPPALDGSWLGMFYMSRGGARTVALHGNVNFVWG